MRRKSRKLLAVLTCAALHSIGYTAYSQVFTWDTPTGGTFSTAGNWTPSGPPNAATESAPFNLSNTYTVTLSTTASYGSLTISGGSVTFFSSAARTMSLAGDATFTGGTTTLNFSTFTTAAELDVGARLNVASNTFVTAGSISVAKSGTNGTLNIDGGTIFSTSSSPVSIGASGLDGTMTMTNGAVGTFAGGLEIADSATDNTTGTFTLTSGTQSIASQLTLSGGNVAIGIRDGSLQTARVIIVGGSTFTHNGTGTTAIGGTSTSAGTLSITRGAYTTATGTFTVNSFGTVVLEDGTFTARGPVVINGGNFRDPNQFPNAVFAPQDNVTVINGGRMLLRNTTIFQPGSTLTINSNGGASFERLLLGDGGSGTVIVDGSASALAFFTINSGGDDFSNSIATLGINSGGAATVNVTNGALLAYDTVHLGTNGGAGTINVSSGSRFTTNVLLDVGTFGRVSINNATISFHAIDVSAGRVIVDAASSIEVKNINGSNSIRAQNGGTFSSSGSGLTAGNFDIQALTGGLVEAPTIGNSGSGSVAVDGVNSRLNATATGTASVWNGSDSGSTISFANFGRGSFNSIIAGSQSGLTNINIGNSGSLNVTTLSLGEIGTARMTIGGDGAQLIVRSGGIMNVGTLAGSATVTVSQGGLLNAGSATLNVSGLGRLVLDGGEVLTNSVNVSGLGSLLFNSGTLTFNTGSFLVGASGQFGNTPTLASGQFLRANVGGTTVQAARVLTINGGTLSTNTIVNSGDIQLFSGGVIISGTGSLTVGPTGMLDQPLNLGLLTGITAGGQLVLQDLGQINQTGGSIQAGSMSILGSWLYDGGPVSSAGTVSIGTIGVLNIQPNRSLSFSGTLSNDGVIDLGGGTAKIAGSISLINTGLLQGQGLVDRPVANNTTGEVRPDTGASLRFTRTFTNSALITLNSGTVDFPGGLNNTALGRISGRGGIVSSGTVTNSGSINLASGISDIQATISNLSGGKIIVSGLGLANFFNNVTNAAGSELRISTGSTAVFYSNVSGLAQITGSGTAIFESSTSLGPLANAGQSFVTDTGQLNVSEVRQSSLHIDGKVIIEGSGPTSISRLGGLSIAGTPGAWTGKLDLNNAAVILDYDGVSPLPTILDQIKSGFANGAWNGTGITSSKAHNNPGTAVGYAEASEVAPSGSYFGNPVDGTTLLVKYTFAGDGNLDGGVDIKDLYLLASHYNASGTIWTSGDFNYDGTTNAVDLGLLAHNWQSGIGAPLSEALASLGLPMVSVPEPTVLPLLAGTALLARRRRR